MENVTRTLGKPGQNKKGTVMKNILVMSGPSGVGKTTLLKSVTENFPGKFTFSVSATTRLPRADEVDGKNYHFLENGDFDQRIQNGEFAEWAEVHGAKYGTLKSEIKRIIESRKAVLLDIDVIGGMKMKELYQDDVMTIMISPPSLELLEKRLRERKSETEEQLVKRLSRAKYELSFCGDYDYVLTNETLPKAVTELASVVSQNF